MQVLFVNGNTSLAGMMDQLICPWQMKVQLRRTQAALDYPTR